MFNRLLRWQRGKESTWQCRRYRFDSWVRKTPGEGNGNPLQYSCLENSMDRGGWRATVHKVGLDLATKTIPWCKKHKELNGNSTWMRLESHPCPQSPALPAPWFQPHKTLSVWASWTSDLQKPCDNKRSLSQASKSVINLYSNNRKWIQISLLLLSLHFNDWG